MIFHSDIYTILFYKTTRSFNYTGRGKKFAFDEISTDFVERERQIHIFAYSDEKPGKGGKNNKERISDIYRRHCVSIRVYTVFGINKVLSKQCIIIIYQLYILMIYIFCLLSNVICYLIFRNNIDLLTVNPQE